MIKNINQFISKLIAIKILWDLLEYLSLLVFLIFITLFLYFDNIFFL